MIGRPRRTLRRTEAYVLLRWRGSMLTLILLLRYLADTHGLRVVSSDALEL